MISDDAATAAEAPPNDGDGAGRGDQPETGAEPRRPLEGAVLLLSVFVVASCGIAYELVIGATGAYIAGDGVTQFSLTIGVFLFAMGIGSFLSRQVETNLLTKFIAIEIVVGIVGGFSNTILYLVYGFLSGYDVVFYALLLFIGTLIGLEIPLLLRLLARYGPLRVNVSNVLALDYVGALVVAVCFPLVLLPTLGLMRTSLVFGILNVAVAGGNVLFFRRHRLPKSLGVAVVAGLVLLIGAFAYTNHLVRLGEAEQYDDEIILTKQTKYQRIILTRWRNDLRMYLNRSIQFSSRDEHRYHEVLVHPALSTIPNRDRILILGGGDGLGVREVLKYRDVGEVVLVDLDKELVDLCRTNPHITKLNRGALSDKRVKLIYRDAWAYLREDHGRFNAILVDLPDPSSERLAKLYTYGFYRMARRHLAADGALVVQSTSPYFSPGSFWSIHRTLEAAGLVVVPVRVHVPSFGMWGFNLASFRAMPWARAQIRVPTKFLSTDYLPRLFQFPKDQTAPSVGISTVDNPRAVFYYQKDFHEFFRAPETKKKAVRRAPQ